MPGELARDLHSRPLLPRLEIGISKRCKETTYTQPLGLLTRNTAGERDP